MGATARALRALVLLAGFYLLGIGILALLIGFDVTLVVLVWKGGHGLLVLFKVLLLPLLLTVPVIRGMFVFRGRHGDVPAGLPVTEERQPALWASVRDVARRAGTRPPRELILTGEVNAAVAERSHLLGLVPGRRRMYIGVPLLMGLTEPQLQSVLAHELGHYGNRDTRLAGITMRGRAGMVHTIEGFEKRAAETSGVTYRLMARLYGGYAKFYMRASLSVGRRQELAADLSAARITGRDTTASALREIPLLDAAFDFYVGNYATMGWDSQLLPPNGQFYGGLRMLLDDPVRQEELARMRSGLPDAEQSAYDSHPPIAERVRAVEALPDDGRGAADGAPAVSLLHDPEQVLAALEAATLAPPTAAMRHVEWDELVQQSLQGHFRSGAAPLREAAAESAGISTLPQLLDAIDAGRLWDIAAGLPKSQAAAQATGRAAREFARPGLRRGLSALTVLTLADAGLARWALSWSRPAVLVLPDGCEESGLAPALDAAVADDPDTAPLRAFLAGAGLPALT